MDGNDDDTGALSTAFPSSPLLLSSAATRTTTSPASTLIIPFSSAISSNATLKSSSDLNNRKTPNQPPPPSPQVQHKQLLDKHSRHSPSIHSALSRSYYKESSKNQLNSDHNYSNSKSIESRQLAANEATQRLTLADSDSASLLDNPPKNSESDLKAHDHMSSIDPDASETVSSSSNSSAYSSSDDDLGVIQAYGNNSTESLIPLITGDQSKIQLNSTKYPVNRRPISAPIMKLSPTMQSEILVSNSDIHSLSSLAINDDQHSSSKKNITISKSIPSGDNANGANNRNNSNTSSMMKWSSTFALECRKILRPVKSFSSGTTSNIKDHGDSVYKSRRVATFSEASNMSGSLISLHNAPQTSVFKDEVLSYDSATEDVRFVRIYWVYFLIFYF